MDFLLQRIFTTPKDLLLHSEAQTTEPHRQLRETRQQWNSQEHWTCLIDWRGCVSSVMVCSVERTLVYNMQIWDDMPLADLADLVAFAMLILDLTRPHRVDWRCKALAADCWSTRCRMPSSPWSGGKPWNQLMHSFLGMRPQPGGAVFNFRSYFIFLVESLWLSCITHVLKTKSMQWHVSFERVVWQIVWSSESSCCFLSVQAACILSRWYQSTSRTGQKKSWWTKDLTAELKTSCDLCVLSLCRLKPSWGSRVRLTWRTAGCLVRWKR